MKSKLPVFGLIVASLLLLGAADAPAYRSAARSLDGSVAKIVGEASRSAQTIKLRQFTRRSGTNLR